MMNWCMCVWCVWCMCVVCVVHVCGVCGVCGACVCIMFGDHGLLKINRLWRGNKEDSMV